MGFVLLLAWALAPAAVRAQEPPPLSLEQIVRPFQTGLDGSAVLNAIRGRCLDFRVDDPSAQQRLRQAGADAPFLEALRGFCYRGAPEPPVAVGATADPPARRLYSPSTAMVRGFIVPGLGQFYTQRPALGSVFLAGGLGALAAGVAVSKKTVECLAQTAGSCPSGQVRDSYSSRPLLLVGVAGFLIAGAVSGFEAAGAARRLNSQVDAGDGEAANRGWSLAIAPGRGGGLGLQITRPLR